MDEKTIARFWIRVDKNGSVPAHVPEIGPCWLWTGKHRRDGRGVLTINGKKDQRASRVVWEITRGSPPGDLCVLHKCDNPKCVRPEHLFLGTHLDNMRDMDAKGRRVNGRPRLGESNNKTRLTADQVVEIRKLYAGGVTQEHLAQRFGMKQGSISNIVLCRVWRHLPGAQPIIRAPNADSKSGVFNRNSKLNPDAVREIRIRAAGGESFSSIARYFGISINPVRKVALRLAWRHVN